jgi:hypothetical protein
METTMEDRQLRSRWRLWSVAFLAVSVGTPVLIHWLELRGLALIGALAFWMLSFVFFVREISRLQAASGCASPAMLRYNRRIGVITVAYIAAIATAVWAAKTYAPAGPLAWLIALVPAVPVLAMVWAMMRLIVEETDEYLRARIVEQAMIATGFMLAVVTVYGFLESFDLVPHIPAYGAFIVWCLGLGVAGLWRTLRRS